MVPVVMECIVRVCASPRRFEKFAEHAASVAHLRFSSDVVSSVVTRDSNSDLLRNQWEYDNEGLELAEPVTRETCLAYAGAPGRVTVDLLESVSRDVLAGLAPELSENEESAPWILVLTALPDDATRREIRRRHPLLDQAFAKKPALV